MFANLYNYTTSNSCVLTDGGSANPATQQRDIKNTKTGRQIPPKDKARRIKSCGTLPAYRRHIRLHFVSADKSAGK
jgi:hypothetical protein